MNVSFLKNLLDRRVPQIIGVYFGGSWGVLQFVEWLVNRYMLSPYLTDFSLVILVSLIPTVLVVAYLHGKPGRDKWTKVEKIGIPVNLLLTVVLLILIFYGKDLGAATKTVTVADEEGKQIERVVPKSEFRKKTALFFIENKSGDAALDWLQYGITYALDHDVSQDVYLYTRMVKYEFGWRTLEKAGFQGWMGLPFAFKRKLAEDYHLGYFLTGSFTKQDETFSITTTLYETKRGKKIAENTFDGRDIFQLVDEMSVQLKHDLEIPTHHIEEAKDLPVSAIFTNSFPAFETWIAGLNSPQFGDYTQAMGHFEQAVKEDPTFAHGHSELAWRYNDLGKMEKAKRAAQTAMGLSYKLTERELFWIKSLNYWMNQEFDKQSAVSKMWVELYPEDVNAYLNLASHYLYFGKNQLDQALEAYQRVLELDPERYDTLYEIGQIYIVKGEFGQALNYYQRYADQFPNESRSFRKLGSLHEVMRDYEKARSYYEKSLIIEPDEIYAMVSLAKMESRLGNFEAAFGQLQNALKMSKTPQSRAAVYESLEGLYGLRGQMTQSLENSQLKFAEMEKFSTSMVLTFLRLLFLGGYIEAGKPEAAFQILKTVESQLEPPLDKFVFFGYLSIYLALEDADKSQEALNEVKALIEQFNRESMLFLVFLFQGGIDEIRNQHQQAIESYQKAVKSFQSFIDSAESDRIFWDISLNVGFGRCYRNLKQFKPAEEYLQKALKDYPSHPEAHYKIALVYWDMGKKEKALEHLNTALEVWKDADTEYKPAKRAREKLAEWQN